MAVLTEILLAASFCNIEGFATELMQHFETRDNVFKYGSSSTFPTGSEGPPPNFLFPPGVRGVLRELGGIQ